MNFNRYVPKNESPKCSLRKKYDKVYELPKGDCYMLDMFGKDISNTVMKFMDWDYVFRKNHMDKNTLHYVLHKTSTTIQLSDFVWKFISWVMPDMLEDNHLLAFANKLLWGIVLTKRKVDFSVANKIKWKLCFSSMIVLTQGYTFRQYMVFVTRYGISILHWGGLYAVLVLKEQEIQEVLDIYMLASIEDKSFMALELLFATQPVQDQHVALGLKLLTYTLFSIVPFEDIERLADKKILKQFKQWKKEKSSTNSLDYHEDRFAASVLNPDHLYTNLEKIKSMKPLRLVPPPYFNN